MEPLATVGEGPPKPQSLNKSRRRKFRVAFQDHFLSGMRGAFFFAFLTGLAIDLTKLTRYPDWDRILRYVYLLWFIAYFFMAAVNNKLADDPPSERDIRDEELPAEWPGWRDILYDAIQALA